MTFAATPFLDPSTAPVFGLAGLAAQMAGPMFRTREAILTAQLVASCSHATSYALLGQDTATAVCLTGAIQTTIALMAGERAWMSRIGYVFLPVVLTMGALTFSGLPTILAITACCLMMIGRMQADLLRMRGVQLAALPFGATHDAVVGAWPALAGATLTFTISVVAFQRALKRRHRTRAA